jgi:hypothetical protein
MNSAVYVAVAGKTNTVEPAYNDIGLYDPSLMIRL